MNREPRRQPVPADYDGDPERFRMARSVLRRYGGAADIHQRVARRLLVGGLTPVLDLGCGEGELARYLPHGAWVGLDNSPTMLAPAPGMSVRAEATALPLSLIHISEPTRPY